MDPERRYPLLSSLLSPFCRRHRKTLGLVIAAIAVTGQARSFAIGTTLARWLGTRLDSAVNRFYRLLKNERVDEILFVERWARQLARGGRRLLLGVDWTEWHHDLRMLVAAVVVGKRAIPLWSQAFAKVVHWRSQNARENTFLRVLKEGLRRAGLEATVLCDRGFRRASWIQLLQQLELGFVVRLMDDVHVEIACGCKVALRSLLLTPGRVEDLGLVSLRSDGVVTVRVIAYWAPGAREPWWLATSHAGAASEAVRLYDRRMTVEEQFRDIKGQRFGVKLYWTHFRDPETLARFVMLLAVALLLWILAGRAAAYAHPSLRMICRKKGPRQSYVTIGLRILALDQSLPLALTYRRTSTLLEPPAMRSLGKTAVGGK